MSAAFRRGGGLLVGLLLALAAWAAFANGRGAAFLLDDDPSIRQNYTIRHLGELRRVLSPPSGGLTVSGRPLVNLTFALNWAWSADRSWSYHVVNLLIHFAAACLLFGLARRTFRRLPAFAPAATTLAAILALLWELHPLQTESVTYVVQRAEAMMAVCYLAVLYAVARTAEAQDNGRRRAAGAWGATAAMACLLGIGCKEVIVSAPVVALLYDRAFFSGTFAAAWRRRRWLWCALAATWIPLGWQVASTHDRGGTAGFGIGLAPWQYWWTQGPAFWRYLRLTFWPDQLVLDYGFQTWPLDHPASAVPANLLLLAFLAVTVVLLRRRAAGGFLAFWFAAVLAPTSIIPGNRQSLAEHRMYLALAPLLVFLVAVVYRAMRRSGARRWALAGAALAALAFGLRVRARNAEYLDPERLWRANLVAAPRNPYTYANLGVLLYDEGRNREAEALFRKSLEIDPKYAAGEANLGVMLQARGASEEAIVHDRRAFALNPRSPETANNLGVALATLGRWPEAIEWYSRAVAMLPEYPDALANLGIADRATGRLAESEARLRRSLAFEPRNADAHYNLGLTLKLLGRLKDAEREYAEALRLRPKFPVAESNWGVAAAARGHHEEAVRHFTTALRGDPKNAEVLLNRGLSLAALGRRDEAIADYRAALHERPNYVDAYADLGAAWIEAGKAADALQPLETARRLAPGTAQIPYDLGLAYRQLGRSNEAIAAYREALRLAPDLAPAANNLAVVLAAVGRVPEAADTLRQLLARHPDDRDARANLQRLEQAMAAHRAGHR